MSTEQALIKARSDREQDLREKVDKDRRQPP